MSTSSQPSAAKLTYRTARVRSVERLTPSMTRIGFVGPDLRDIVDAGPDQYVKLFFPAPGQVRPELPPPPVDQTLSWYRTYLAMPDAIRPPMRTYTIRALRPERGEVDIDFVLHGDDGPASRWARRARPGDEIALLGPHGLYAVPEATGWQLLVGDETAIPAIGAIVENVDPGTVVRAFIEVSNPEDRQDFPTSGDVELRWISRGSAPRGAHLLDAIRAASFPVGPPYAWISGEAGMVRAVRRHLVADHGVGRRDITFTGYWRVGKSEEDTGRERMAEHSTA